jgi:SAM-dependent methyltransferase
VLLLGFSVTCSFVVGLRLRGRHALFPPKGEEKEQAKPARHLRHSVHDTWAMPTPDVHAFVRASLPPPPARVLEIGAGGGELAAQLGAAGYDVLGIDPAGGAGVRQVPLHLVDEADGSFDAAVAVVSLHHVEPLDESCRRLGELVAAGGRLVVDEFDVERFDEVAAAWWIAEGRAAGHERPHDAPEVVVGLRSHLHALSVVTAALAPWFGIGEPVRGAYMYRWDLDPGLRAAEERLIAGGRLPAIGARFVAVRLPTGDEPVDPTPQKRAE